MSGIAEYSSDNKVLLKIIKIDLETFLVPSIVEEIRGGGTQYDNPFIPCANSIKNITFEKGSALKKVSDFAFSSISLQTIDMSSCENLKGIPLGCFYKCRQLAEIKLPPNTISLGIVSFRSCGNLKDFQLPDSVTTINNYIYNSEFDGGVFTGCYSLKSIGISETSNLNKIGSYAFLDSSLESIFIPKSLQSIDMGAFVNTNLKRISISSENTLFNTDGTAIFKGDTIVCVATGLYGKYQIKKDVKFAGAAFRSSHFSEITFEGDFYDFTSTNIFQDTHFSTITLPSKTKVIKCGMFLKSRLVSIVIPNEVTTIEIEAFSKCNSLVNITLPKSLEIIQDNAFNGCGSLLYIEIPYNVTEFGQGVFSNCNSALRIVFLNEDRFKIKGHLVIHNGNTLVEYFDQDPELVLEIPAECTTIGKEFFASAKLKSVNFNYGSAKSSFLQSAFAQSTIQSIVFPPTLSAIQSYCFNDCKQLKSVKFDGLITSILWGCFKGCSSLNEFIFVSKHATIIEKEAFKDTPKLLTLDLSDLPLQTIESYAFSGCGAKTLTLPSTVTALFEYCLAGSFAEKIIVNCNIESIPSYFAEKSDNLNSVEFSQSIKTIGSYSFKDCPKLVNIVLGQQISKIEAFAFQNCQALKSIIIPVDSKFERIMPFAFDGCLSFDEFIIQDTEKFTFDYGALMNANKTSIIYYIPTSKSLRFVVPGTTEVISSYAFSSCNNLYEIIIPDGVIKTIGVNAFENCLNLRHIIIPKSVTELGVDAFIGCTHFKCGGVEISETLRSQFDKAKLKESIARPECINQEYFIEFCRFTCKQSRRVPLTPVMFFLCLVC